MQVYKKILVAMDCSAVDDAIIAHVSSLAIQNNAQSLSAARRAFPYPRPGPGIA